MIITGVGSELKPSRNYLELERRLNEKGYDVEFISYSDPRAEFKMRMANIKGQKVIGHSAGSLHTATSFSQNSKSVGLFGRHSNDFILNSSEHNINAYFNDIIEFLESEETSDNI